MADKKGEIVNNLIQIRNEIRAAEEVVKKLKEDYNNLQEDLLSKMRDDKLEKISGTDGTASISVTEVANVTDWEKFYRYIARNKAYYMLQKRVADAIYRETLEERSGRAIPGVETFKKVRLNLRSAS